MSGFEALATSIQAEANLEAAVATLIEGVADRIKATSNDQNIQKLARDLRTSAPLLTEALKAKHTA